MSFFARKKKKKTVVLSMTLPVSIKYFSQTVLHGGSGFAQNFVPLLSINKPSGSWKHGSTLAGRGVNRAAYHFYCNFHLFLLTSPVVLQLALRSATLTLH